MKIKVLIFWMTKMAVNTKYKTKLIQKRYIFRMAVSILMKFIVQGKPFSLKNTIRVISRITTILLS